MALRARTRYAKCGDVDIAYQVLGDGPLDVLHLTPGTIPIDCMDEEPELARLQRRLTSFGRLIRFDRRGVGLSDRGSPSDPPTPKDWTQDALAVLEAVGSQRAAVFSSMAGSHAAIMLSAEHPDRVTHLVLVNGQARLEWAPDYPDGVPEDMAAVALQGVEVDAVEQGFDFLAFVAPSVATDPTFRAWIDRSGNLGATPAMARALHMQRFKSDTRALLPNIRVPALIIHRSDIANPTAQVAHGRYLAEHIPGAKYVELSGVDSFYWVGDTRDMLDEIEEFLTGVRGASSERVLATVLFTDIVGSTNTAVQLGDDRWRTLLDHHDQTVRVHIGRFRGREVNTVGDSFVATFDSPGRAIECALAIRDALGALDIAVRAGIHSGEIETRGDEVAGIAVHIGARVSSLAGPGEVFVSSTVKDLVTGSDVDFVDRGEHELKGVPGTWRIFAVET